MNKKHLTALIIILAVTGLAVTGCFIEHDVPELEAGGAWGTPGQNSGTWEGTGRGFGGDMTIAVTLVDGIITDIRFVSHNETAAFFSQFNRRGPTTIARQANSFEASLFDAISGVTDTRNGFIEAGLNALSKIPGAGADLVCTCCPIHPPVLASE